jgi:hypothetical protein
MINELFDDLNKLNWVLLVPEPGIQADQHLVPNNDLMPHDIDSGNCACHPVDDLINEDIAWIHNAFDRREDYTDRYRKSN